MRAAHRLASIALATFVTHVHITPLTAQTGSMRVTLPSPTAASLGKFGDVPVSLYSGVPDVSIPLFTVKGRTLELPITLRYHAGGIKVEEAGGWAGLGWSLDAGGTVTRSVRGAVDEGGNGYYTTGHNFYNTQNWQTPTHTFVKSIADGTIDGEPDRFFFSFAGRSGQFVMGPTSSSSSIKEYRSIPHQKLKIEPTIVTGDITQFRITTEDGTRYTFAAIERTKDLTLPVGMIADNYGTEHNSTWHLTEIHSPGGDVITLHYSSHVVRHANTGYREKFDWRTSECGLPDIVHATSEYEITVQRLDSINAAQHLVAFTSAVRADALSPTGTPQEYRLDHITVTTPSGTAIRRFKLTHDYYPGNRLRLKSVQEQTADSSSLPAYTFDYDGQTLPARTSNAVDHWGYFNGAAGNTMQIPAMFASNGLHLPGANRAPSATHMKAGVLTRITYPTGGFTDFVFEPNDYGSIVQDAPLDYGPQQLRTVQSNSGQGLQTTAFTVGGTAHALATLEIQIDQPCPPQGGQSCPYVAISGVGSWTTPGFYTIEIPTGSRTLEAMNHGEQVLVSAALLWQDRGPVKKKLAGGLRVAQVTTSDGMGNTTTRRYRYTLASDTLKSSGVVSAEPRYHYSYVSPQCSYDSRSAMSKMPLGEGPTVGYSEVTVWHGVNGEHGRTRHTFRSVLDVQDVVVDPTKWPFAPRTSHEWQRGQTLTVQEFNALLKEQRSVATEHQFRQAVADSAKALRGMSVNAFSGGSLGSNYVYHRFEIISAWTHPKVETTTFYADSGSSAFSTARTYTHANPVHLQLTEIRETNSDGTIRITRMTYPADYASGSGNPEAAALTAMKGSAHMHSHVIERSVREVIGGTEKVVEAELTTFRAFGSRYLPYRRFVLNRTEQQP